MADQELIEKIAIETFVHPYLAKRILGIIKEAGYKLEGYVKLAGDQTPPENPFNSKKSGGEASAYNGFEVAKLRYRNWRKVELEE